MDTMHMIGAFQDCEYFAVLSADGYKIHRNFWDFYASRHNVLYICLQDPNGFGEYQNQNQMGWHVVYAPTWISHELRAPVAQGYPERNPENQLNYRDPPALMPSASPQFITGPTTTPVHSPTAGHVDPEMPDMTSSVPRSPFSVGPGRAGHVDQETPDMTSSVPRCPFPVGPGRAGLVPKRATDSKPELSQPIPLQPLFNPFVGIQSQRSRASEWSVGSGGLSRRSSSAYEPTQGSLGVPKEWYPFYSIRERMRSPVVAFPGTGKEFWRREYRANLPSVSSGNSSGKEILRTGRFSPVVNPPGDGTEFWRHWNRHKLADTLEAMGFSRYHCREFQDTPPVIIPEPTFPGPKNKEPAAPKFVPGPVGPREPENEGQTIMVGSCLRDHAGGIITETTLMFKSHLNMKQVHDQILQYYLAHLPHPEGKQIGLKITQSPNGILIYPTEDVGGYTVGEFEDREDWVLDCRPMPIEELQRLSQTNSRDIHGQDIHGQDIHGQQTHGQQTHGQEIRAEHQESEPRRMNAVEEFRGRMARMRGDFKKDFDKMA